MKDSRLEPADQQLLDQAIHAWRENLPDDARMRRIESSLAPVLDASTSPRWWLKPYPWVGAVVIAGIFAGMFERLASVASVDSPPSHHSQAPMPASSAVAVTEALSPAMPTVSVDSLASAPVTARSEIEARPAGGKPAAPRRSMPAPMVATQARPEGGSEASASPDAVAEELALLDQARRALAADPARTLTLTDEHAKRFTHPSFAQERERLAIDALVRLGQRASAQERATRFEATFPTSPHLERVRQVVRSPAAASSVETAP